VPTQHIEASYFDVSDVLRVVRNIDVIAEFARRALPTLFEFVDALLTRDRRRGDADVIESLLLVCQLLHASSSQLSTLPLFFGLLFLSYRVNKEVIRICNQVHRVTVGACVDCCARA